MTQRLVIRQAGADPELDTTTDDADERLSLIAAELLPLDRQVAAGLLPSVRVDHLCAGQVAVARAEDGTVVSVQAGMTGAGLGAPYGTFATRFAGTGASICPLPSGLDPLVAAAGASSAIAARLALDAADAGPGDVVCVTGAGGAVGSAACELARDRGCGVVPVTRTAPAADAGPWDVVIDCAAGPLLEILVRGAAPRARHVIVGYADGGVVSLALPLLLVGEHRLIGFNVYRADRRVFDAAHAAALDDLARGIVTVPVERRRTVPLDQAADAYAGKARVLLGPPE